MLLIGTVVAIVAVATFALASWKPAPMDPEPTDARQLEEERKAAEKQASREEQAWTREGPQTVGMPCGECGQKIVVEGDAQICGQCERPVHKKCIASHVDGKRDEGGPYR